MKTVVKLALISIMCCMLCVEAYASADLPDGFDLEAQMEAVGADKLEEATPEQAREMLEDAGVDSMNPTEIITLSPKDFIGGIIQTIKDKIASPLKALGTILGICIMCAMLYSLKGDEDSPLPEVFSLVSALAVTAVAAYPILECVSLVSAAIKDTSTFMITFVPVLSGAMTAAGQPISGALYNVFLFGACQIVAQIAADLLVPLMGVYLAVSIAGAISPDIKADSVASGIKSVAGWGLGLIVTVFVGLLSIQTIVGSGADTVTDKAAKFMLGNFVPVVGSALSDAFTTARGCLRLIKSAVGAYGIIAAALIILPALINTLVWYLAAGIGAVCGEVMGIDSVTKVMTSCKGVLGLLMSVLLCFALLIIVSTALVMLITLCGT
jgi:stage III sporulation protein AE